MGQGHYMLLGYGCVAPPLPQLHEDAEWEGWCALLGADFIKGSQALGDQLRDEYECAPGYLVVPLAVSDSVLAECWEVPCLKSTALELDDLPAHVLGQVKTSPVRCRALWEQVRVAARAHGVEMPRATYVVVFDYS